MEIRLKSISNKIDFKWIRFLVKWILNRLDQSKSRLDKKLNFLPGHTYFHKIQIGEVKESIGSMYQDKVCGL